MDYFSQSLAAEYGPKGIHVQCQSPGFVATAMTKQKPSLIVPTPAQYARTAVDAIGSGASVVPYWSHKIVDAAVNILPQWLVQWQVRRYSSPARTRWHHLRCVNVACYMLAVGSANSALLLTCAASAAIGVPRRDPVLHTPVVSFFCAFPRVRLQVRNMHADINRRYLRKLDREAAAKTAPAASGADSGADPKKKA